jgi:hypothetical protein
MYTSRFTQTAEPWLWVLFALTALACSSARPAVAAPHASQSSEPAVAAEPAKPDESVEPQATTSTPSPSAETPRTEDDRPKREIQYVVTPEGLEIRVEGVRFMANASEERRGAGWGVKLSVSAVAKDDEQHSLLRPKNGPLSLAGVVERGNQREQFGDERQGAGEQVLNPGKPAKLTRSWPAKGESQPLADNQTLDLDVGLWGLGKSAAERRPVRSFFHVKLAVEQGKARVSVTPPASAKQE